MRGIVGIAGRGTLSGEAADAEPVAAPDPAASFVSRCVPGVRVAGCRFGRAGELHRSAKSLLRISTMLGAQISSPVSVSVLPTFTEYLSFNFRVVLRRMRLVVAFAVVLLAAFLCAPLLPLTGETVARKYVQLLPTLILPALMFVAFPITIYSSVRRQWRAVASLREARTYTFTDAGVRVVGDTFEGFVDWSHIAQADRLGGQVLLATGQRQFYLVPFRSFGSDEAWGEFRRLVASKVRDCRL